MDRMRRAVWLCLAIGCGGETAAPAPESSSGAEAASRDDEPMTVVERLAAAVEAGDEAAMLAELHPAIREEARGQLSGDPPAGLLACLRETIERGTVEPLTDASGAAAQYGEDPRQIVVPGRDDETALIRHEGRWYLLDTGC